MEMTYFSGRMAQSEPRSAIHVSINPPSFSIYRGRFVTDEIAGLTSLCASRPPYVLQAASNESEFASFQILCDVVDSKPAPS